MTALVRFRSIAIAAILLFAWAQTAVAQVKYPTRPIRFIVAFGPGGVADIVARLVGERLSEKLGQTVFIDNKGGAAGALGAKVVSTSEPDGYTFLVTTTAIAIGAAASADNVDPRKDLVPVAIVASSPTIISAKAPNPVTNLPDFVRDLHKTNITFATSGVGTVEHLTAAYILKGIKGIEATHIPYRSGGEALNAVISSQVDLSVNPIGPAMSFIQGKQLQLLGVASGQRLPRFPDVPTFAESGLSNMESGSWVAVFGPPGLPNSIATTVNTALNQAMQDASLREALIKLGFDLHGSTQAEFADQIKSEVEDWKKVLKDTGITLE
jgi:tripartite-type tricarboxylate transporter receptor subunit TctC